MGSESVIGRGEYVESRSRAVARWANASQRKIEGNRACIGFGRPGTAAVAEEHQDDGVANAQAIRLDA